MKTLTLSAIALTVLAGAASAATSADFDRFGVDQEALTPKQELLIENALSSGDNFNEKAAAVRSIVNNG